jgi:hypothetical protein
VEDIETGGQTQLFNPRPDIWSEHFAWAEGGQILVGLTATGRVTVVALQLNNDNLVVARSLWIAAGWHPSGE